MPPVKQISGGATGTVPTPLPARAYVSAVVSDFSHYICPFLLRCFSNYTPTSWTMKSAFSPMPEPQTTFQQAETPCLVRSFYHSVYQQS